MFTKYEELLKERKQIAEALFDDSVKYDAEREAEIATEMRQEVERILEAADDKQAAVAQIRKLDNRYRI